MDREDRIRQRAYRIWEDEGCPDGRDREHWDRAAQEVDGAGSPDDEATGAEKPGIEMQSSEAPSVATAAASNRGRSTASASRPSTSGSPRR
jgi:hypothetical protein